MMSHKATSSVHALYTVALTMFVLVVENSCKQKRRSGGETTWKGRAVKVISMNDHMCWSRIIDIISSDRLYAKKLRGRAVFSMIASGQGGETFASCSP